MPTKHLTPEVCTIRGCKRSHQANGLCNAHNMRRTRGWEVDGPIKKIRRLTDAEARRLRRRYVSPEAPTVRELAEELGVAKVTVQRALRGERHRVDDGLQERIAERARDNEHPGRRA
jgi:hypothetical protein